jgi:hypothetical protein
MASRQIATVGSHAWIANERSIVQQLEDEDVEIMAYAIRNDMEWLNEHMANIFERNILYATHSSYSRTLHSLMP